MCAGKATSLTNVNSRRIPGFQEEEFYKLQQLNYLLKSGRFVILCPRKLMHDILHAIRLDPWHLMTPAALRAQCACIPADACQQSVLGVSLYSLYLGLQNLCLLPVGLLFAHHLLQRIMHLTGLNDRQ